MKYLKTTGYGMMKCLNAMSNNIIEKELQIYDSVCNDIVKKFIIKHFCDKETKYEDIEWDWVCDEVGDVAYINDYYISMSDMIIDLKNNVPKHIFFEYYEYSIEWHSILDYSCGYNTYLKGFRHEDIEIDVLKKQIYEIEQQHKKETDEYMKQASEKFKEQYLKDLENGSED